MPFDLKKELQELSEMLDLSGDQINPKKVQAKILAIESEIESEGAEVPAEAFEGLKPEGRKLAMQTFLRLGLFALED